MSILEISDLAKSFGGKTVVERLGFSVKSGEIFGFLGGNGAGKTTSLRMILGIIQPDRGHISVFGGRPGPAHAARIGFLPEERGLYRTMTPLETLVYFGRLKGMATKDARAEGSALLERFGLGANAHAKVSTLSKGMAQKVQIATALINRPELLILDEPFSGLDPINQELLEREIARSAEGGAAVVFSTHIMQHAERLCDRLAILARGQLRFSGSVGEALAMLPGRVRLLSRDDPSRLAPVADVTEGPTEAGWRSWIVTLRVGYTPGDLLEICVARGFELRGFTPPNPSLHDAFIAIAGDPPAGSAPKQELAA